jgi:hypothetical protein
MLNFVLNDHILGSINTDNFWFDTGEYKLGLIEYFEAHIRPCLSDLAKYVLVSSVNTSLIRFNNSGFS